MNRILAAVMFLGTTLTVCRFTPADDWSAYQHDAAHSGLSSATFNPKFLTYAWSAPLGYGSPLVVGNAVYAMGTPGTNNSFPAISSFQLGSGAINWTFATNSSIADPSPPAVSEGLVVFAAETPDLASSNLYVVDAATGAEKFVVPMPSLDYPALMPTIARNANNQLVAYVDDISGHLAAVNLGTSSGSVLWTGETYGATMPTIVGNSVVTGGGPLIAFDQLTGTPNRFFSPYYGTGTTVVFDASRSELYAISETATFGSVLTAFSYTSNSSITQLWQTQGSGIVAGGQSVAIGPDGGVYSADRTTLTERDPANGNVLKSVGGLRVAAGMTPAIDNRDAFVFTDGGTTNVYDLSTFAQVGTAGGSRGSLNTDYDSPGAIFDAGFVQDYGPRGAPFSYPSDYGFSVYTAPEPSTAFLGATGALALLYAIRRR